MISVKILGAGSIGNHLAHACRSRGWQVMMCDIDPAALERTRLETYPQRYGSWDEAIRLGGPEEFQGDHADLVIIGTPPDTHTRLALEVLGGDSPPRILLIEKPVCPPDLDECGQLWSAIVGSETFVCAGYNHVLTPNTLFANERIANGAIGRVQSLSVYWREHWGGIFNAHPWLAGPSDSYLGFAARGGGAASEHSHGINIWQHFARGLGAGRVVEVSATMDFVEDGSVLYDRQCLIHCRTEHGLVGDIVQDVVTDPAQKKVMMQGDRGRLQWYANIESGKDAVFEYPQDGQPTREYFEKTRPGDFSGEIAHLARILESDAGQAAASPIRIEHALDTTLVVAAAMKSAEIGRKVVIDYGAGYRPESLVYA